MERISRRSLLARSAMLVGAAYGAPLARAFATAPGAGLSPARARTYTALVRTASTLPGSSVDPGRADWAAARFAADYAARLPDNRRDVDAVLDALARSGFGEAGGVRHLRALARGRAYDCELSTQALALAAVPFSPTIDGDDLPPVPIAV
jgi:hypothetical protein